MSEADKTSKEELPNEKAADAQTQENTGSSTHPICQNAKDQEKCEEFVE